VSTVKILDAWKKTENSLQDVAGTPVVDENLLRQVGGGIREESSGYWCTVSGECNGGRSCWWPF
jgi:hypothetical protein